MRKADQVKALVAGGPIKEPPSVEALEQAIIEISAAMKKMTASRLKREALVLLIHDASKVGKPQVRAVLDCLDQLEIKYLKPKKAA